MNIKASYENIPTGSMQNSTTSGSYAQSFVNWADFKTQRQVIKYATLEHNRWLLDGTFNNFPNNTNGIGYISTIMSDANGDFSNAITITRTYTNTYKAPGLMIEFDSNTDDYAVNLNVKWYLNNSVVSDEDFEVDSAIYFCENPVDAYNKVVITITNMNKPYRFLKIFNIADGMVRNFENDEIENLEIIEQIEPTNSSISINQTNLKILPLSQKGVFFQRTLPFKIYRDDALYGNFFISKSTSNTGKTFYSITADDYIGILDYQTHMGGMYSSVSVPSLIADIMGTVPYELDNSFNNITLSGYLPIQSRREALKMVAFSISAMIDTSRRDKVIIKPFPISASSTIGKDRIISIETTEENITTKYELNNQLYIPNDETSEIYKGTISGTSYITFSSPMHDLTITNGTLISSDVNYAVISGSGEVVLSGKGYDEVVETFSKSNPYTVTTDIEKKYIVESTMIGNTQSLLDSFNFVQYKIKAVFLMQSEKVGDIVNLNGQVCRIVSLEYDLTQKDIYATAELEAYFGE